MNSAFKKFNFRQLPKKAFDLLRLRFFAVRGKQPGQKGKETFMYHKVVYLNQMNYVLMFIFIQEDVERCLNIKFISQEMKEGIDYILYEKWVGLLENNN